MLTKEPGDIGWIFIKSVENICVSSAGRIVWHQIQKSKSRAKAESAASQMGTIRENSLKENLSGCEGHRVSTEGRRKAICLPADFTGGGAALQSQTGSASWGEMKLPQEHMMRLKLILFY